MPSHQPDFDDNDDINTSIDLLDNRPNRSYTVIIYGVLCLILLVLGVVIGVMYDQMWGRKWQDTSSSQAENHTNQQKIAKESTVNKNKQTEKQAVLTVEVIRPQVGKVPLKLSADGVIVAKNIASVSGKVSGVAINQVLVKEGDWVEQGQPLATFDHRRLQQNVIQAQAQLAQAQAGFNNAKATVERVMPLLKIDAISRQAVDGYITQAEQAKATLIATQAQLHSQQLILGDTKVIAPVSGIISEKKARVGELPQGALFNIIEGGVLEWQAQINPSKMNQIRVGTPVMLQSPNRQSLQGRVSSIDPVAGKNRQVQVRAILQPNPNAPIQAGMLLSGSFIFGEQSQLLVPVSAIIGDDGYNYLVTVNRIKKNAKGITVGTVKRIKVQLGEQFGNVVAVRSKIHQGTAIVRQGGAFLSDGDTVRLAPLNQRISQSQHKGSQSPLPSTLPNQQATSVPMMLKSRQSPQHITKPKSTQENSIKSSAKSNPKPQLQSQAKLPQPEIIQESKPVSKVESASDKLKNPSAQIMVKDSQSLTTVNKTMINHQE